MVVSKMSNKERLGRSHGTVFGGFALGTGMILTAALNISLVGWVGVAGAVLIGAGIFGAVYNLEVLRPLRRRRLSAEMVAALVDSVDGAPEGRVVTDADGHYLYGNKAYQELSGTLGGAPPTPLQLPWGTPSEEEKIQRLAHSVMHGLSADDEVFLRAGIGGGRWVIVSAHPISGAEHHVIWYLTDVTDQHEIQEMARQEEAIRQDYLDNAPVGFYSVDDGGIFVFVNTTFAGWLGYSPFELMNGSMSLAEVMVDGGAQGRPDGTSGDGDGNEVRLIRASFTTRSGEVLPTELLETITGTGETGRTHSRTVVRNLALLADGDPLMTGEPGRFGEYVDNAPIGIALVQSGGAIIESNRTFKTILGVRQTADDLNFLEWIAEGNRDRVVSLIDSVVAGRGPTGVPVEIHLVGDEERSAQFNVSPIDLHLTPDPAAIVYLTETTGRKNLELQFAQSQKMQAVGQLAGGIAHDFNNLLTAILGFCDLLLLRHQAGDSSFADIMQVKQNANRASNLVRQLLAFSRQQTLRPKVLVLTDVLAELSNLLRRLIGEKTELEMVHGRDLGLVMADQGQMEQVIINLAVNARDAMPEGGTLTLRTDNISAAQATGVGDKLLPDGEYVLIEVADTGCGIAQKDLEKIFEPFFTTKEVGEGTGLGLSTVYGIIQQTGGYVLPSSSIGEGACFQIYLPRHRPKAEDAVAPREEPKVPESSKDLTGKGCILLVEDEDPVRTFASRALRNKGYTVLEAINGGAALDIVTGFDGDIDLLISDVVMPTMDGPTLMKRAREHRVGLKCILISGYAEDEFRQQMADEEFVFLPKPFSLKQLAGTVKEMIE
jgi:two-component system, cell cycle sensor histidine kinase and response regulator CckA